MQLKRRRLPWAGRRYEPSPRGGWFRRKPPVRRIAIALAAATCALLGAAPQRAAAQSELERWKFDTALLYYGEGERVTDVSFNVLAQRAFDRGRQLAVRFGVDTLTGASASGAVPAPTPQTFTSPSGHGTYSTAAGETPLDDTFLDTRLALAVNWSRPVGNRSGLDYGLSLSNEFDYFHAGVNARTSRDFNGHNTTLSAGLALAHDTIGPVGGAPIPLAPMLPEGAAGNKLGDDSKDVADLVLGVAQVLGKRTIGQINYSLSYAAGYLTDPYKLLSVVDPDTGLPVAGPGALNLYRFESRPDSRTKHSLFVQLKRQLRRDVIDGSYRYMTDDWGVNSHTFELRYRLRVGRFYLQPHLRWYTQTAADFYRTALFDGKRLPRHASADYRLGEFDGRTYGLKFGLPLGQGREWGLRLEYYEQSGRAPPQYRVGALRVFDLYPTVSALIFQAGYRF